MDSDTQLRAAAPSATRKQNRRPPGTSLDGRSREYKLLLRTRGELLATLPAEPTVVQLALVEECAWATVRLHQLNATMTAGKPLSKNEAKAHTGLSNIRLRALSRLADAARPHAKAKAKQGHSTLRDLLDQRRADTAP